LKNKDEEALKKAFEGVEKAHNAFQKIARASANACMLDIDGVK
jgi:hypothetical protein